jgi:hypothetical protein
MMAIPSSREPTFSHRMAQTEIKLSFAFDQRECTIHMNPGDSLKKMIVHARTEFQIPDDLEIFLRAGPKLLDNLDQSFESSGLRRGKIIVEYSARAKEEILIRRERDAAIAHKVQCAEHQKWRREAEARCKDALGRPGFCADVARYDLQQYAQVLDSVITGANAEQMEQLFTTLGLEKIDRLVANVMRDPSWTSQAKCDDIRQQVRAIPIGPVTPTPPKPFVNPTPLPGPHQRIVPLSPQPFLGPGSATPQQPNVSPPVPNPAPPPLTTQTLGFGEIILPSMRREDMTLPNIGANVQISGFEKLFLQKRVSEEVDWQKVKGPGNVSDCWVSCDKDKKPQIAYFEAGKDKLSTITLEWLKEESSQSQSPVPAVSGGGGGAAAAAAGRIPVPISEVLKVPEEISSHSSFSMMLKLENCELLLQFRGDADMKKFERAIKHVYRQSTGFFGQGHRLDASVSMEDKRKCVCMPHLFVLLSTYLADTSSLMMACPTLPIFLMVLYSAENKMNKPIWCPKIPISERA